MSKTTLTFNTAISAFAFLFAATSCNQPAETQPAIEAEEVVVEEVEIEEVKASHILIKPSIILSEDKAKAMLVKFRAQLEAGEAEFNETTFDLVELVRAQHKTFAFRMQEKAVEVKLHLDDSITTQVMGDKMFINQILMNLLGNATKFTKTGSITIHLKKGTETKDHVFIQFSIMDTGIGIEDHKIDSIFDTFSQADSSISRRFGGTGLGLSISKRLVQLNGGNLSISSEPGKGTQVSLTFNASRALHG